MRAWRSCSKVDIALHHELKKFVRASALKGSEYTESRLNSYLNVNDLAHLAKRSSIGVTDGTASVFFARFYSSYKLIKVIESSEPTEPVSELCSFMEQAEIKPNYQFTRTCFSALSIYPAPTYNFVVDIAFNNTPMSNSFLSLERALFQRVLFDYPGGEPRLREHFDACNRCTEPLTLRKIKPDLIDLSSFHRRVSRHIKKSLL